jgi:hypothetical protein
MIYKKNIWVLYHLVHYAAELCVFLDHYGVDPQFH